MQYGDNSKDTSKCMVTIMEQEIQRADNQRYEWGRESKTSECCTGKRYQKKCMIGDGNKKMFY